MEESNAEWAELTHDCLVNILSRLSANDQWLGAMFACKSWFSAFTEPSLHSVFNLEPYFDLSRKLSLLSTRKFESKIDSNASICLRIDSYLPHPDLYRSLDLVAQWYKLSSKF
ncbi:hypothetical protein RYX36_021098 [Vicia faba]